MQAGGLQLARDTLHLFQAVEHELLVFALFWFVIGALDELAIDIVWIWLRLTGRSTTPRLPPTSTPKPLAAPLHGPLAVFFPTWHEAEVIGATVAHTLSAWPQPELRVFVGCYANDPATLAAAKAGAGGDERVRLVVLDRPGPTTKADCLNRLYAALKEDEACSGIRYRGVILHDAEDMVHPAALELTARTLAEADFVQIPVRPEPQPWSRWVAGHYGDEFIESHAKGLVVRDALGAAFPAAGVGCGFGRDILDALAELRQAEGDSGPFAAECLTEDYELGWLIARIGGRSRFVRVRDPDGELVATRAYFPSTITAAVRQKTRWVHGIAFQSWDRLGWSRRPVDIWMALRDRRGPLTALVMTAAYTLLVIEAILAVARAAGQLAAMEQSPLMRAAITLSIAALAWRIVMRVLFTAREYGWVEGLRAMFRIPVANIIAIMASRRAIAAYLRSLRGHHVAWDKTAHKLHPTLIAASEERA
jgi:adsorption protein B